MDSLETLPRSIRSTAALRDLRQQRRSAALMNPINALDIQRSIILDEGIPNRDRIDLVVVALGMLNTILEGSALAGGIEPEQVIRSGTLDVQAQEARVSEEQATVIARKVFDRLRDASGPQKGRFNRHVVEHWDALEARGTFVDFEYFSLGLSDDEDRAILRLSGDGKTLILGMLEIDETLQDEAERIILRKAWERNLFDDALVAARRISTRAVGFRIDIERLLSKVRRSFLSVDWKVEGVEIVESALKHLQTRTLEEGKWRNEIEKKLTEGTLEPEDRQRLIEIRDVIEELFLRNSALLGRVATAHAEYRRMSARAFEFPAIRSLRNPEDDLLIPLLLAPVATASAIAGDVFSALGPPRPPTLFCLSVFFEQMAADLFRDVAEAEEDFVECGLFEPVPPRLPPGRISELTDWFNAGVEAAGRIEARQIVKDAERNPSFSADDVHGLALMSHWRLNPLSETERFSAELPNDAEPPHAAAAPTAGHLVPNIIYRVRP